MNTHNPASKGPAADTTNALRQPQAGASRPASASEIAVPMPKNEV